MIKDIEKGDRDMKSDDKKKMYDILGIKSVYMEEMCKRYERTDSEKKEIKEIAVLEFGFLSKLFLFAL